MKDLQKKLEENWKNNHPSCSDVKVLDWDHFSDNDMEQICPEGCNLVADPVDKVKPWRALANTDDYYEAIRICRSHGFVRIYIVEGLARAHAGCPVNS